MRIKQSKINELLKIVIEEGFTPLEFLFPDLNSLEFNTTEFAPGYATEYKFIYQANEQYKFTFYYHETAKIYDPRYLPGVTYDEEMIKGSISFDNLHETFRNWLRELKVELEADKYFKSIFNRKNQPIVINAETSDEYFSESEIKKIETYFDDIKKQLLQLDLTKEQIIGLEAKIDDFIASSKVDKKGKWVDYIIGGLFSAVISLAINPDTANKLYFIIKQGIETIIFQKGIMLINP